MSACLAVLMVGGWRVALVTSWTGALVTSLTVALATRWLEALVRRSTPVPGCCSGAVEGQKLAMQQLPLLSHKLVLQPSSQRHLRARLPGHSPLGWILEATMALGI